MSEVKEFRCPCGEEYLVVEKYEGYEMGDFAVSLGIFRHRRDISWSNRLRHIWQIIRKGMPYSDDMYLERETYKDFVKFINSIAP